MAMVAGQGRAVEVTSRERLEPVAAAAAALLGQFAEFIRTLDDRVYTHESATVVGGTIGKHLRHSLDHFRAAIAGRAGNDAEIDYDHRERCVPMESDRRAALAAIAELCGAVALLGPADLDSPVRIRVMLAADGSCVRLGSTLGRELAFATHHAIHHQAMVRAIAAEFGVRVGPEFGKAPSTLNFERAHR